MKVLRCEGSLAPQVISAAEIPRGMEINKTGMSVM